MSITYNSTLESMSNAFEKKSFLKWIYHQLHLLYLNICDTFIKLKSQIYVDLYFKCIFIIFIHFLTFESIFIFFIRVTAIKSHLFIQMQYWIWIFISLALSFSNTKHEFIYTCNGAMDMKQLFCVFIIIKLFEIINFRLIWSEYMSCINLFIHSIFADE